MNNILINQSRPSRQGDALIDVLSAQGVDDPTCSLNSICYMYKRDYDWCSEGQAAVIARAKCSEEYADWMECKNREIWTARSKELTRKRNEMIRNGWVPPHGERQFNLLSHVGNKKGLAMQGPRYEHLDKKKYLQEILDGKFPNYK